MIPRIVIPSKGKPDTSRTLAWFREHGMTDYTVVVSQGDEIEKYRAAASGGEVRRAPPEVNSLAKKKRWMLSELVGRGEWMISIDDNVKQFTGVAPGDNRQAITAPSQADFAHALTPQQMVATATEDIKRAALLGAVHGGFASNGNPYFRKRKYRTVGFVWGKVSYFQSAGLSWPEVREMEDYAYTAMALLYSGKVLINNFYYAEAARFEKQGSTGTYEQRVPAKLEAVQIIMASFPGLYRIAERPNHVSGTEIRMRFHSDRQIAGWRAAMKAR